MKVYTPWWPTQCALLKCWDKHQPTRPRPSLWSLQSHSPACPARHCSQHWRLAKHKKTVPELRGVAHQGDHKVLQGKLPLIKAVKGTAFRSFKHLGLHRPAGTSIKNSIVYILYTFLVYILCRVIDLNKSQLFLPYTYPQYCARAHFSNIFKFIKKIMTWWVYSPDKFRS